MPTGREAGLAPLSVPEVDSQPVGMPVLECCVDDEACVAVWIILPVLEQNADTATSGNARGRGRHLLACAKPSRCGRRASSAACERDVSGDDPLVGPAAISAAPFCGGLSVLCRQCAVSTVEASKDLLKRYRRWRSLRSV